MSQVPVVIDNGSSVVKAGLATTSTPTVLIPCVVGQPRFKDAPQGPVPMKSSYVGDKTYGMANLLVLKHPLKCGAVADAAALEKVWKQAFKKLGVQSGEHATLLTEPVLNPRESRFKMTELIFERFNVPAMYVAIQPVLSLYASDSLTGVVLDSGDGVTQVVPVYDGFAHPYAFQRLEVAGGHVTEYLTRILRERNYNYTSASDCEVVKTLKEKLCYVAEDFREEMARAARGLAEERYELPDGESVTIGDERFRPPEILFRPSLVGCESGGVHELVYSSVKKCDVSTHRDLLGNIFMSGGSTRLPGIDARLKRELEALVPPSLEINISGLERRECTVFAGGTVLSSSQSFREMWVSRKEYDEVGPGIVYQKCF